MLWAGAGHYTAFGKAHYQIIVIYAQFGSYDYCLPGFSRGDSN
jgi:hypothetical protein